MEKIPLVCFFASCNRKYCFLGLKVFGVINLWTSVHWLCRNERFDWSSNWVTRWTVRIQLISATLSFHARYSSLSPIYILVVMDWIRLILQIFSFHALYSSLWPICALLITDRLWDRHCVDNHCFGCMCTWGGKMGL